MKKLTSLLLTFAMLFSLAMPVMAAEGDSVSTIYIDVGQLEFAESVQSVWIYTSPDYIIRNELMTHVGGTIYSCDVSAAVAGGDTAVAFTMFSDSGSTSLGRYTTDSFEAGKNLWIATGEDEGTWGVYSAPVINGSTTGNVTATYNPTAKITGLYITVDGVRYDSSTAEAPVIIYSDSVVTVTVYGENFANLPEYDNVVSAFAYFGENSQYLWKDAGMWTIDTANNTATFTADYSFLSQATTAKELLYTNDLGVTKPGSGVYVIYDDGTKPDVEAKWGATKDSLTKSGTLAEAITAARTDSGITYIQLQKNVTTDSGYEITGGVFTLDLNGNTFTVRESFALAARDSAVEITLTDTATGGEVIAGTDSSAVIATDGGKLVIGDGSYSGSNAVFLANGGVAEINGGTFTGTPNYSYAVNVDETSTVTINAGTFSGTMAAIATSGTTTITGGSFTSDDASGAIAYFGGTLNMSECDENKLNGLTLSQHTGSDLTVPNENIKLPEGFVFQDGEGNAVDSLASYTVYTLVNENSVPTYTINTAPMGQGTITAPASAAEGDPVTVTLTPGDNCTPLNFEVVDAKTYFPIESTKISDTTYTFVMPAANVNVHTEFCLPGTTLKTIYYKGPWTDVEFSFTNSAKCGIGNVEGTMVEDGIYAVSDIPEWSYSVMFRNLNNEMEYISEKDIPTDGRNMYNAVTEEWETYTPSQPPEDTTSAEIVWGSMSFTYSDEQVEQTDGTTADKGWYNDGSENAGTVTVTNTGTTTIITSVNYVQATGFEEIEGAFDATSANLSEEERQTFTLTLTGKPDKALSGDTIGTVTVEIKSADGAE